MRRSGWGPQEKDPCSARAPRQRPTSAMWRNLGDAVERTVTHTAPIYETYRPSPAGRGTRMAAAHALGTPRVRVAGGNQGLVQVAVGVAAVPLAVKPKVVD